MMRMLAGLLVVAAVVIAYTLGSLGAGQAPREPALSTPGAPVDVTGAPDWCPPMTTRGHRHDR
jgi:hypothetical protein